MDAEQETVWSLMAELDYCMLVTQTVDGMRSRPMSSIVEKDERRIYFLTSADTFKDDEIAANPNILLTYSDGKAAFVSTAATAVLDSDRELVRELWNPGAQAFWPEGPETENIIAIVATPTEAHYWDGPNAVVRAIRFSMALATGTTPNMGDEGTVDL